MRKAFRHTGVLMMLGVVALGLVGAAYTLWYEELELNATVSTGTFNVDWSNRLEAEPVACVLWSGTVVPATGQSPSCDENSEYQTATQLAAAYPRAALKLPTCVSAITDHNTVENAFVSTNDMSNAVSGAFEDADFNILTIQMDGLYPFAGCRMTIDIHNKGSVPAHLTIEGVNYSGSLQGVSFVSSVATPHTLYGGDAGHPAQVCNLLTRFLNGTFPAGVPGPNQGTTGGNAGSGYATVPVNQGDFGTPTAVQLHQGEEIECNILVYANETALEGQHFAIGVEIVAHQWNEGVTLGPAAGPSYNAH